MQATVDFLKLPVGLSSGEYPLLSSLGQSLTAYTLATYTLNVRRDLYQSIRVEDFDGSDRANMVRIRGHGLYWIVSRSTNSDIRESVTFEVSACAPSSLLFSGQSIRGDFDRLPANVCPYLQRQAVSGAMETSRTVDLPTIGITTAGRVYWVEITASVNLSMSDGSVVDNDSLNRYGMFVLLDARGARGRDINATTEETPRVYPRINDIINNPEKLGFQASVIQDISISARCPYDYGVSSKYADMWLKSTTGGRLDPNARGPDVQGAPGGSYAFYNLSSSLLSDTAERVASVTLTLSDLERASGQVSIRSESSAAVAMIPTQWGPTITARVQCIGDMGKMLTIVTINNTEYTLQEGHLPFVGSAWSEYTAYSLSYDREAMEQSINFANERMILGIANSGAAGIQSGVTGALAGGPVGIISGISSFALGTASSVLERSISEREARQTQALAERRVQGQAGTPYNAAYGLIYNTYYFRHPPCLQLDMPSGLTEDLDEDFTDINGFPAEGPRTVPVTGGYFRGKLFASETLTGPWLDALNGALAGGIRFKVI